MKIEGGCLCGKVRYSADAEPAFVGVCHCKNCQRGTGTAFAIVGVALGVAALATVMSVTGGFQKEFRDKVLDKALEYIRGELAKGRQGQAPRLPEADAVAAEVAPAPELPVRRVTEVADRSYRNVTR